MAHHMVPDIFINILEGRIYRIAVAVKRLPENCILDLNATAYLCEWSTLDEIDKFFEKGKYHNYPYSVWNIQKYVNGEWKLAHELSTSKF